MVESVMFLNYSLVETFMFSIKEWQCISLCAWTWHDRVQSLDHHYTLMSSHTGMSSEIARPFCQNGSLKIAWLNMQASSLMRNFIALHKLYRYRPDTVNSNTVNPIIRLIQYFDFWKNSPYWHNGKNTWLIWTWLIQWIW